MWSSLKTLFLRGLTVSEFLLQDVAHQEFAATIPWWEMGMNVVGHGLYTYGGSIVTWSYCEDMGNIPVECGNLTVPWDHFGEDPEAEKRQVKLIRLRAKSTTTSKHLFMGMAGPAISPVRHLRKRGKELHKLMGEDFHLVAFDPRGVGESTWRANCYYAPGIVNEFPPQSPVITDPFRSNAAAYVWADEFIKKCPVGTNYYEQYLTTPQLAADIHYVLGKIGVQRLHYWGFSYGAIVGQTYAMMYPDSVGGLVLDAPTNLLHWYGGETGDTEKWTDTDAVFDGFFDECAKAGRKCPLTQLAADKPKNLEFTTKRELKEKVVEFATKHFSEKIRRAAFTKLLHEPSYWLPFADSMAALMRGGGRLDFLPLLNDETSDAMSTDDPLGREKALRNFLFLNDARTGPEHWPQGRYGAVARIMALKNVSEFSLYDSPMLYKKQRWVGGRGRQDPFGIVVGEGEKNKKKGEAAVYHTRHPILFLASKFDPASPLVSALNATAVFNGSQLIQVDGYGHGSLGLPSECVMGHVLRYFKDRVLPENGTNCTYDASYFEGTQERAIFHGVYPSAEDI